MPSIDERIVSATFDNAKFEAAVAVTMATLAKLDASLQEIGKANSLADIEKAADKVTLDQPTSALDKLKAKFSRTGADASDSINEIEKAGNKVTLEAPAQAADKLQSKLNQVGAGSTFTDIEGAANRVDFAGLSGALDGLANKFSVLQGAAAVALGGIAAQAAQKGAAFAKSFALGPIQQGLGEYTTNLNSIQTILANTQDSGGNLETVNAALSDLNNYSDKTIYNFGEMARNIGTFTAAGVKLDTATQSIKGIANLAALSGSNSQQASTAMYQLSQAIAAGKVNLQDWNSVVNAGMGGAVFQKALFNTGKAMGTITNSPVGQTFEQWKKAGNTFRQSLSATQKAAQDGTTELAKAQKDGAKSVADAHTAQAEAVANAAKRVKDAQESQAEDIANAAQRVKDAQESQAEATKNAADRLKEAEASAAEAAASAAEKVKEAHKGVSDTAKQSAADLKDAQAAQIETFVQSSEDVKSALDAVTEARKRLVDALKPPSEDELQAAADKLKTAQLDQADLATAVTDAQTEQKRSAEDLEAAQKKLAQVQNGGSPDEIRAATRAVEDAEKRKTDAADAVERAIIRQNSATRDVNQATKDLTDTQNKGTEADKNVVSARDAVTTATEKYAEAQKTAAKENAAAEQKVRDVTLQGIADRKKAAADLVEAEAEQTKTLKKNRETVAKAEADQAKTIIESRDAVAKAEKDQAKTIIDSREKVAEAEKDQAKTIIDSREKVRDAEESAAERIKTAREKLNGGKDAGPPSWLTSDVLTNTLKQFTGDMTTAQLKAQGFNDEQIKAIQQTAKTAGDAATKVKTLGQVFSIARETIGSGWSKTFQTIFGDFGESRKTFTSLSNTINGFINTNAKARNKVLGDWKELGGRTILIEGIKNAFKALGEVIKPIKDAFRDIFPAQTGQGLFDLTKKFEAFTEKLKPSAETVDNLRRTFRGFFALLHIGVSIVKGIFGVIGDLLGLAGGGGGSFLGLTGSLGDFLVKVDEALTKGGLLKKFFDGLSSILQVPVRLIGKLASAIGGLFGGADTEKSGALSGSLDNVNKAASPLAQTLDTLKAAWDKFVDILRQAKDLVAPWLDNIGGLVSNLGTTLSTALQNVDFNKAMGVLQTGFIGGIFLTLRKAISGNSGQFTTTLKDLSGVFKGLTGNLEAMQQKVKAQAIFNIAAAIGILAAAVFVLSTIEPKKLASAMTAVAVGLGELMAALKLMSGGLGKTGMATLPIIAVSLVGVAIAVTILAGAMKIFATMSWEDIAKGLVGIGGGLVAVGIGLKTMGPSSLAQAPALIGIAIALNLMAFAVKQFAGMKWEELGRGIAAVFGVLIASVVPLSAAGPGLTLAAPGVIGIAIALNIMAVAVKKFGSMDLATLTKGLIAVTIAVTAIGFAVSLLPPTLALQAAGLVILGVALTEMAGAIGLMGKMDLKTLVKGITAFAGVLAVLAIGLTAMAGTLPGSAALLVAAAALAILAPTLGFMGNLDWGTIIKGLAAIALVLGTLSVVGLVASSGLVSLGISLLPLAGVLVLTAGAVFLFAKGLALLGDSGAKGIAVMVTAVTAFIALLPSLVISFVKGLLDVAEQLAGLSPKIVEALSAILTTVIQFVVDNAAKLAVAVGSLIDAFLTVIVDNAPKIIAAGYKLLLDFLKGLDDNIVEVASRAASIIVKFITTLADKAPDLIAAGVNLLVKVMEGLSNQVPKLVEATIGLVTSFLGAIVGELPKLLLMGASMVTKLVTGILGKIDDVIEAGLKMIVNIITGIGKALPKIVTAAGDVIIKFVNALADVGPKVVDAGFKALIDFLHGIAKAIRENNKDLVDAGLDIASAIVDGIIDGLGTIAQRVIKPVIDKLFDAIPGWARKILGIHSPSRVFMEIGQLTAEGMAVGLQNGTGNVATAAGDMGDTAVSTLKMTMGRISDVLDTGIDSNPTITPVLDLTHVRKGIKEINGIGGTTPIDASSSLALASSIATEKQPTGDAEAGAAAAVPVVKFEQNNYSPESLSNAEIYRQTQNQLSQVKSALGFTDGGRHIQPGGRPSG